MKKMARYLDRAIDRIRARGIGNVSRYSLYLLKERVTAGAMDLRFGGRLCRTDLDESVYNGDRHTMVHSNYHVLRDIFTHVPISKEDVLVDVGCGEGRVINFWLSQGFKNPIVGIEVVASVAEQTRKRYRRYPNVSIVTADAVSNLPSNGTVFFLYNPFSENAVRQFEKAVRLLKARIVYYQNNYMSAFDSNTWGIELINSNGAVYEFQAALITRRREAAVSARGNAVTDRDAVMHCST